jgi:hypothetical protein
MPEQFLRIYNKAETVITKICFYAYDMGFSWGKGDWYGRPRSQSLKGGKANTSNLKKCVIFVLKSF